MTENKIKLRPWKHGGAPPSQTLSEDPKLQQVRSHLISLFPHIFKPVACVSLQDRRLRKLGESSPNCICLTLLVHVKMSRFLWSWRLFNCCIPSSTWMGGQKQLQLVSTFISSASGRVFKKCTRKSLSLMRHWSCCNEACMWMFNKSCRNPYTWMPHWRAASFFFVVFGVKLIWAAQVSFITPVESRGLPLGQACPWIHSSVTALSDSLPPPTPLSRLDYILAVA